MVIMNGRDRIRGFTMVELLIVIMVISALAAIAVPSAFKVRENGRRIRAQAEVNAIAHAIEMFYDEYGMLPLDGKGDMDETQDLLDLAPALAGTNRTLNPRGMVFLDFDTKNNPQFLDPWDGHYQIRLDTNYNGYVAPFHLNISMDNPSQGGVRALMLVGTPGQDGVWGTESDVVSSHSVHSVD